MARTCRAAARRSSTLSYRVLEALLQRGTVPPEDAGSDQGDRPLGGDRAHAPANRGKRAEPRPGRDAPALGGLIADHANVLDLCRLHGCFYDRAERGHRSGVTPEPGGAENTLCGRLCKLAPGSGRSPRPREWYRRGHFARVSAPARRIMAAECRRPGCGCDRAMPRAPSRPGHCRSPLVPPSSKPTYSPRSRRRRRRGTAPGSHDRAKSSE